MSDEPLMPGQVKAARELLGWTRVRLAYRVGVSEKTVEAFESGEPWSRPLNLDLVRERLESAGVEFTENGEGASGVRLRKPRAPRRGRPTRKTTAAERA